MNGTSELHRFNYVIINKGNKQSIFFCHFQKCLTRSTSDCESEKKRNSELQMKETELRVKQNELENKLEDKQKDVDRLDKMLELVKQECNSQANQKVRYNVCCFLNFI